MEKPEILKKILHGLNLLNNEVTNLKNELTVGGIMSEPVIDAEVIVTVVPEVIVDSPELLAAKAEIETLKVKIEELTKGIEESNAAVVEATKKVEEAENKSQLFKQEAEASVASAVLQKTAEALKTFISTPLSEEAIKTIELDESVASIASKLSFTDLVKQFIELSKEVAEFRDSKQKEEALKLAEARYAELAELGVAFNGDKEIEQKDKVANMTEEAFASYKVDLQNLASSITVDPETLINKAREAAGKSAVVVGSIVKKQKPKYNQFL